MEDEYCGACDEVITEVNEAAECPRCDRDVCFLCETGHWNSEACG
jgi:hypothetical protein